ncbi:MAG: class I SAM-dependent methyltransferase [Candidatus Aenigmarchaeota archaeon]|nr:class I SAM-dependent methyltransferase [Candidatus Aenigmarchaeota archaeon]
MLDSKIIERVGEDSQNFEQHLKRYVFASKFVKNKRVLDVACGTGYGTEYLAKHKAKEVIGVDNSKDAIAYSKGKYSGKFLVMDATKMQFKDNYFDVVVSFETIEHIKDWGKFIDEIKRITKQNGTVVMSTPNYKFEIVKNKYHVSNFKKGMFIRMFNQKFGGVRIFGQSKWFLAFPGRGIFERLIGYNRNSDIHELQVNSDPQILIGVGKVIKR